MYIYKCINIFIMKKNTWTNEEIEFLKVNYPIKGVDFCVDNLNYTKSKIFAMTHKLKLKMLPNIKKKYTGKPNNLCNVNPSKFENIVDKDVSYFLGLLWADGHIIHYKRNYHIVLTMLEDDIMNIKWILDKVGKWNYNKIKKGSENWKNQIRITTNNKRIYDILYKYDFTKKSKFSPEKLLNSIPNELHSYFYLGLIDGDGCFYIGRTKKSTVRQFSISSTYEQDWSYLEKLFNSMDIKFSINRYNRKSGSSYSFIRVSNKKDITKIGEYIYKDIDRFGLDRKFFKYNQIIS